MHRGWGVVWEGCPSVKFTGMCSSIKYPYSPNRRDWNFLAGGGFSAVRPKYLTKCMKRNWNFQRGGRGSQKKSLCWGRYGYFLELHNISTFMPIPFTQILLRGTALHFVASLHLLHSHFQFNYSRTCMPYVDVYWF